MNEMNETPQFEHDCYKCVFLGRYTAKGDDGFDRASKEYDLYVCDTSTLPTVIARYGNDGPEYLSGIPGVPSSPPLMEAARRAIRGFIQLHREKEEQELLEIARCSIDDILQMQREEEKEEKKG